MSVHSYSDRRRPVPLRQKLCEINWRLVVLITLIACAGFAMLYSAAGGSFSPWAERQMIRFVIGFFILVAVACVDLRVWMGLAYPAYVFLAAASGGGGGGGPRRPWRATLDRAGPVAAAALRADEDRAGAGACALICTGLSPARFRAPSIAGAAGDDRGAGGAGADAAQSRHRDAAGAVRRAAAVSRGPLLVLDRAHARRGRARGADGLAIRSARLSESSA